MDDLISREEAITLPIMPKEYRKHKPLDCDDAYEQGWSDCQNCIGRLPTAEKKGEWIKGTGENGVNTSLYCDQCGYENGHWYEWNYCPNCGARMEESE